MKLKNKDEFRAEAALRILTAAIQAQVMSTDHKSAAEAYSANAEMAVKFADSLIEKLEA